MKYEAPELTALTSAINAVQTSAPKPILPLRTDQGHMTLAPDMKTGNK